MQTYFTETPVATFILAITVISSIYAFSNPNLLGKFMLHPYSVYRKRHLYTVLTSALIHRDWGHLLFNMLTFFFFGFPLERLLVSISSWGHLQFFFLYFLGIILSDLPTIFKQKDRGHYFSLGASGAICTVLFSFILFNPGMSIYLFFIPIPIPAVIFGPIYLIYCAWAAKSAQDHINHDAHFYGAITGVVLTILVYPGVLPLFFDNLTHLF